MVGFTDAEVTMILFYNICEYIIVTTSVRMDVLDTFRLQRWYISGYTMWKKYI